MGFDKSKYTKGYSIGVGGVVMYKNKVLLVRRARGEDIGEWAIPGGFVEQKETIDDAILREVAEETGINTKIKGLIAVRNRIYKSENSAYFIFLLEAESESIKLEKAEVDKVKFFNPNEALKLKGFQELSKIVVTKVLEGKAKVLSCVKQDEFPDEKYSIFD